MFFTDRIDKGIGELSARAFDAVASEELDRPVESDEDKAQRELLMAVSQGRGSQLDENVLREAANSGLVDLSSGEPSPTPLGEYLLSLELATQPDEKPGTQGARSGNQELVT